MMAQAQLVTDPSSYGGTHWAGISTYYIYFVKLHQELQRSIFIYMVILLFYGAKIRNLHSWIAKVSTMATEYIRVTDVQDSELQYSSRTYADWMRWDTQ